MKLSVPAFLRRPLSLIKDVGSVFSAHNVPRLGAALSYYTVFSIGPLLMVVIAIVGFVFGEEAASGQLFEQLRSLVGAQGAQAVEEIIKNSDRPKLGAAASIVGFALFLLAATGVFAELKNALNTVWSAESKARSGVIGFLRDRLLSFTMVLAIGFMMMVSLLLSGLVTLLSERVLAGAELGTFLAQAANVVVSLVVFTALMAAIYKFLPDRHIPWRDVWVGAAMTTVLFIIGRQALAAYLGRASATDVYGAASSLVLLLLWTYYCSQILLLGASITFVYSERLGSNAHDGPLVKTKTVTEPAKPQERPAPIEEPPRSPLPTAATSMFGRGLSPKGTP